jgi:excisionase family DNA binding protein
MSDNDQPLLTASEVAELFRVNPKTISRWVRERRITGIRTPGGHGRFRESDVRAALALAGRPEAVTHTTGGRRLARS